MNTIRLLLLALALPFPAAAAAPKQPNVLFILCDDIRPAAIGCYGSKHVKTPNMDRLAKEGVLFQNTFCTTSLCSPSRASILTGLYAHAHGVRDNFTELPTNLTHWPQRLREAGYETAYMGKWHMGEDNDMPRWGFDFFATHKGQGKYFDTEFNFDGKDRRVVKGYYTTVVTDMALDWLKKDHSGKPWALCVGHKAPHSFYTPEPKYEHTFDSVRVAYPQTAFELDDKPAWMKERLYTWHGIYGPLFEWRKKFPDDSPAAVKDFEAMVHGYWGTILSVDDSIARLVTFLEGAQPARQHDHRLHGGQRPARRRARHGGQTHDARGEHPHPAHRALPGSRSGESDPAAGAHRGHRAVAARTLRRAAARKDPRQVVGEARARGRRRIGARRGFTNTTTRSSSPTRRTSAACAPTSGSTCATRTATVRRTGTWPNFTT